jgi:hypothetical protein
MKQCIKCKKELDKEAFDNDRGRVDGKYPYCKDCRREINGSKKLIHKIVGYYNGLAVIYNRDYPRVKTSKGWVRVHRYIIEQKIGRSINKNEHIHHIDGNKQNWQPDNLILMTKHNHLVLEGQIKINPEKRFTIKCSKCGRKEWKYMNHKNKYSKTLDRLPTLWVVLFFN